MVTRLNRILHPQFLTISIRLPYIIKVKMDVNVLIKIEKYKLILQGIIIGNQDITKKI